MPYGYQIRSCYKIIGCAYVHPCFTGSAPAVCLWFADLLGRDGGLRLLRSCLVFVSASVPGLSNPTEAIGEFGQSTGGCKQVNVAMHLLLSLTTAKWLVIFRLIDM